jgi:UPF0755 protein
MKKIILLLVAVVIILTIFGYKYYSGALHYALNPDSADRIVINVKKGDSASAVADQLYEKGLIKSTSVFKMYLDQKGLESQIKAGRIVVQTNFTLPEIVAALAEGKSSEMSVTILEGWTAQQIADQLASMDLTTAYEFMECLKTCEFTGDHLPKGYLEGYLYPDTYFVDPGSYTNQQFIQRLIDNFENKLADFPWGNMEKDKRTFEEVMIMASIVEREESDPEERPTVAGILWNRFDANIGLGADATVLYALGRTKGGLTYDDLQVDSQYNTRKYAGLPPTPICNPSITSILAAVSPTPTDYWYYLHDNSGEVHYARTLDEHNVNKAKFIN